MNKIDNLAEQYCEAFYQRKWTGAHEPRLRGLSVEEAYAVQDRVTQMRVTRGEAVAGFKIGCTSKAIQTQFGFDEPIHAKLFHPHIHEQGAELNWKDYGRCAIEPEMVLKIGMDLAGDNLSDAQLVDAIVSVSPGIEIHNFQFWHSPPTVQELICSGGIHVGLAVGQTNVDARQISFEKEMFSVYMDGLSITKGPASEVMGGPLHSLRWLVKCLTRKGERLKKGSLVIPGSPVELVPIEKDTVLKVEVEKVGALSVRFKSAG